MKNITYCKEQNLKFFPLIVVLILVQVFIFLSCKGQYYKSQKGCVEPDSSIIAWWTMDEDTSLLIHDIIGQYNGVMVNEATHLIGMVGNAVEFDGINDYIAIPDNDIWAFGNKDFTIELWANFNTNSGGSMWHPEDVLISHNDGSGSQRKWWFGVGSIGLHFHINAPEIGPKFFPVASFTPEIGRWYHLAVTRANETYTLFIDGIEVASEINNDSIANPSSPLVIGQANEPFGGYFDGYIDEVSIYNSALSEEEILAIYQSDSDGKCKNLSITTESIPLFKLGNNVSFKFQATLGIPPYYWSVVNGSLPDGLIMDTMGVLTGVPEKCGSYNFTIGVEDEIGGFIERSFTSQVLLSLPTPELKISQSGTIAVPGREIDYFILLENTGFVAAEELQIIEVLNPDYLTLVSAMPEPGDSLLNLKEAFMIYWDIPIIQPNENLLFSYKVKLAPDVPLGDTIMAGPVTVTPKNQDDNAIIGCVLGVPSYVICAASVACFTGCITQGPCLHPGTCIACMLTCAGTVGAGCALSVYMWIKDCIKMSGFSWNEFKSKTVGPIDPNEKLVLAEKYIKSNQTLVYPIHYENIGEIEAKDIFITDTLDNNLDFSTLEILTPEGSSFDEVIGILKWELYDVNLQPGETENVLYSIKPKPNLSDGTIIKNKASIQFEVFDVFTTNEVFNIIDNSPPTSQMEELSPITSTEEFNIFWNGNDPSGQIKSYSVFMSIDSGDFEPYLTKTTEQSALFVGEYGKSYSFICIAEDSAGNIEAKSAIAEAKTLLQLPQTVEIIQNSPNPFIDQTVIEYLLSQKTEVILKIYDIGGREIVTLVNEIREPGIHRVTWKPISLKSGLYFCRLITPETNDAIKLVYESHKTK